MKKILVPLAVLGLIALPVSCDLTIPESVSIKTNADYNFSIGDIEKDFNSSFDKNSLFADLEGEYNKIYDYFPGQEDDKLQNFLLVLKIEEISLGLPSGPTAGSTIPQSINSSIIPALANYVDVNMDLSSIFNAFDVLGSEFKEKAEFYKIPMYIYCNIAQGFLSTDLRGNIKVSSFQDPSKFKWTIGDEDTKVPLSLAAKPNLLNKNGSQASSGDIVVTDVSKSHASAKDEGNMTAFINENKHTSGGLRIDYDLELNKEGTVFDGKEIDKLSIYIILELPFKFKVNSSDGSDLAIDVKSLANNDSEGSSGSGGSDSDIFRRDEITDTSDMDKYLDAIEGIVLGYKTKKNPFISDSTAIVVKSDWPKIEKELEINGDEVKLTSEEFRRMLKKYPYNPDVYLMIPCYSSFAIPRDISLNMNIYVALYTNGVIKF